MSKMKDVYVIKVKTKPPLASLYPSERRYSASTVGGLSMVHLGLSILAFLLGALARSLQGPVLSFGCLVPFISGLLAWRRWYIDKNISFFFYGSLFSLVVSILCGVATVFDIAAVTDNGIERTWNIFTYPERFDGGKNFVGIIEQNETDEGLIKALENETKQDTNNWNDTGLSRLIYSGEKSIQGRKNCTESVPTSKSTTINTSIPIRYFAGVRNGLFSLWQGDSSPTMTRTNILLDINVLITCLLEISWSLLSVNISLRGMRNRIADASYDPDANNFGSQTQRVKPRAPQNPVAVDEQLYSRDVIYDENLRNFRDCRNNSGTNNSGPRLPLPESNKEFRERVERFLANQAAHRIVEGSCS